jgi:uncharacterized protein (TIGR03382 family)
MNKVFTTLLAGSLLAGLACAGHANTVLTATFAEDDGQPFAINYTESSPGIYTLSGSLGETITFSGPWAGVPGPLNTAISTTLTFSATVTEPSTADILVPIDTLTATFSTVSDPGFLTITAGSPPNPGSAGELTVLGTGASSLSNNANSNNVLFTSSPPVIDTSSFIVPTETVSFSFTLSQAATFAPFPNGFLETGFSALITGDLAVQVPTPPTSTPEPGSVAFVVGALVSSAALLRRRRK